MFCNLEEEEQFNIMNTTIPANSYNPSRSFKTLGSLALRLFVLIIFLLLVLVPEIFIPFFKHFTQPGAPVIYNIATLSSLTFAHLSLVFCSLLISMFLGVSAGIFVTRKSGNEFLMLSRAIANFGQTFPPVAILALAVSMVGFGLYPTIIALALYGLLPIFENTVAGLSNISESVSEAADAMGMSAWEKLRTVELPLAMPLILEGIKIATVINIGTATIGSTVAAKCLGEVIMAGLLVSNTAYVLQGGVIVGLMAILIYDCIQIFQKYLSHKIGVTNKN